MPDRERIRRPGSTLHGGAATGVPGDRETRFAGYDSNRENKES